MKWSYRKKLFSSFVFIFSLFTVGIFLFEYSREKAYKTDVLTEKLDAYTEMANAVLTRQGALDSTYFIFPENLRLTLIDLTGNVVFDNRIKEISDMGNHSDRPEIVLARKNSTGSDVRKSASNNREYIYYAKRFHNHYLRVALPYSVETRNLLKPDRLFVYYLIGLFVVILLIVHYASVRFGRSIQSEIVLNDIAMQEKTRQLKQEMTGNITHELRTPVTGIRGCLETILENQLDTEKERRFIQNAYHQTLVLSELIQDLGLLTKIEDAPAAFGTEEVNMQKLIADLNTDLEYAFREKNMTMTWNIPGDTVVVGNKNLLHAIFRNLCDNAIRYAGANTAIHVKQYDEDSTFYHFSFADNGVGIPEEHHLNRLFERFYRIGEGRTRDTGGSGLGLSIVKNAVAFHKGTIVVKNRVDGGLEFLFTLRKGS